LNSLRNCTLTTLLFPANIAVMSLQVGELQRQRRSVADGGIYTQVWFGFINYLSACVKYVNNGLFGFEY
jgi:hypothetical protein